MMDIIIQIDGQDEVETDKAIDIYNSLQKNKKKPR